MSGRDPDWAERTRAAIARRARAVIYTDPQPADLERLNAFTRQAESAGVAVMVDRRYTADATFHSALPGLTAAAAVGVLIDSIATAPPGISLAEAVLHQLDLTQTIVGPFDVQRQVSHAAHYVVTGTAAGVPVTLTGVRTEMPNAQLRLDVVSLEEHWTVRFDDTGPAAPPVITRATANGQYTLRPHFESGRRAALIALHQAIEAGEPPPNPLHAWLHTAVVHAAGDPEP